MHTRRLRKEVLTKPEPHTKETGGVFIRHHCTISCSYFVKIKIGFILPRQNFYKKFTALVFVCPVVSKRDNSLQFSVVPMRKYISIFCQISEILYTQ